jgi:hypothetical protein
MAKPRYKTVHDYMERTGTSQSELRRLIFEKTGNHISPSMFSMILSGSRRCSRWNGWSIHLVTGVPFEEIVRWPRYKNGESTGATAELTHEDC